MPALSTETILIFFVALTGIAMFTQAIVAIALYFHTRKATAALREQIDDLRSSIVPVFQSSRQILDRIAPRIEPLADDISKIAANVRIASGNVVEIAHKVKAESDAVQASAEEVLVRVRQQTARVDGMVTGVLDAADRAGSFVERAVSAPARQLAGVLAAAKAIVDTFRSPNPEPSQSRSDSEKDMFV
jgi:methyl-accepting chemotaxis protein